jgi:hypothetical protein
MQKGNRRRPWGKRNCTGDCFRSRKSRRCWFSPSRHVFIDLLSQAARPDGHTPAGRIFELKGFNEIAGGYRIEKPGEGHTELEGVVFLQFNAHITDRIIMPRFDQRHSAHNRDRSSPSVYRRQQECRSIFHVISEAQGQFEPAASRAYCRQDSTSDKLLISTAMTD